MVLIKRGQVFATSNSQTDDLSAFCNPSEKWLIVTHGFNQNCSVEFIIDAVSSKCPQENKQRHII